MTVLKNFWWIFILYAFAVLLFSVGKESSAGSGVQIRPQVPEARVKVIVTSEVDMAAGVYGKAKCGDRDLAERTARYADRVKLPAELVAAVVVIESTCNPLAVSHEGAIGLMQVVPKTWAERFDFEELNLLDPDDNLRVGTEILAFEIQRYGIKEGVRHYNGEGPTAHVYSEKVLRLAFGDLKPILLVPTAEIQ